MQPRGSKSSAAGRSSATVLRGGSSCVRGDRPAAVKADRLVERAGGLGVTTDNGSGGNQVATIVVSPYTTPGTKSGTAFTHYSLLRTTGELLGIPTFLGNAALATSMRPAFGL